MDAAFVISIKTRHDRTELQPSFQHAANRDASWFFFSVMVFPFLEWRYQNSPQLKHCSTFALLFIAEA
jgi:hypothetical protein